MLVDEVTRVGPDNAIDLLVDLADRQQTELMEGRIFIPIVTTPDPEIFPKFAGRSKRPAVAVQLPPLTEVGIAEEEKVLLTEQLSRHPDAIEFNVQVAVAQTMGHLEACFRTRDRSPLKSTSRCHFTLTGRP